MTSTAQTARPLRIPRFWNPPFAVTAIFATFIVARYMQWGARKDIFEAIRIEFLLGIMLIALSSYMLSLQPLRFDVLPEAKRVLIGICLLFFTMIIQIPIAADPALAQIVFWDRVIKFAMLTFFIMALVRSPDTMRWFMAAFLFACFYVTQESARGALNGGLIWENQGIMRLHGAVPIYRHPNSLAGVAAGTIPFAVFVAAGVRRWWVKGMLLAPLATATLCVMYSGSRTGYLGVLAFLLYWWSQSDKKLRWVIWAVALGVVLVPLIPKQYIERFQSIGGEEAEGHSKEARLQIIEDAVAIFMENPAGVGVASFPAVRRAKFGRSQDTHNLYLEVATNLGIQGLAVFLFLVGAMYVAVRKAIRDFRRRRRELDLALRKVGRNRRLRKRLTALRQDVIFLEMVAKATNGFLLVRLVLGLFGMDLYEVYWWFAAGLAIALLETARRLKRVVRGALLVAESP